MVVHFDENIAGQETGDDYSRVLPTARKKQKFGVPFFGKFENNCFQIIQNNLLSQLEESEPIAV